VLVQLRFKIEHYIDVDFVTAALHLSSDLAASFATSGKKRRFFTANEYFCTLGLLNGDVLVNPDRVTQV
jgi:hypothetical protein